MDAQQWFYILGIAFIVSWFFVLVGLIAVGVMAYQRYQQLKHNVQKQGAFLFTASRIIPPGMLVSLAATVPFVTKLINAFRRKRRR